MVLAQVGVASRVDVDRAVTAVVEAQRAWAALPFTRRAQVMRKAEALLRERALEFGRWNTRECGSIPAKAKFELDATCEQTLMVAALPMQPEGMLFPSSIPGRRNMWRQVRSEWSA